MKHGGRILVVHESFEHGHYGELNDNWEEIDHPDAVMVRPLPMTRYLNPQGQVRVFSVVPYDPPTPIMTLATTSYPAPLPPLHCHHIVDPLLPCTPPPPPPHCRRPLTLPPPPPCRPPVKPMRA